MSQVARLLAVREAQARQRAASSNRQPLPVGKAGLTNKVHFGNSQARAERLLEAGTLQKKTS